MFSSQRRDWRDLDRRTLRNRCGLLVRDAERLLDEGDEGWFPVWKEMLREQVGEGDKISQTANYQILALRLGTT